jgi:hypothetical protein
MSFQAVLRGSVTVKLESSRYRTGPDGGTSWLRGLIFRVGPRSNTEAKCQDMGTTTIMGMQALGKGLQAISTVHTLLDLGSFYANRTIVTPAFTDSCLESDELVFLRLLSFMLTFVGI